MRRLLGRYISAFALLQSIPLAQELCHKLLAFHFDSLDLLAGYILHGSVSAPRDLHQHLCIHVQAVPQLPHGAGSAAGDSRCARHQVVLCDQPPGEPDVVRVRASGITIHGLSEVNRPDLVSAGCRCKYVFHREREIQVEQARGKPHLGHVMRNSKEVTWRAKQAIFCKPLIIMPACLQLGAKCRRRQHCFVACRPRSI